MITLLLLLCNFVLLMFLQMEGYIFVNAMNTTFVMVWLILIKNMLLLLMFMGNLKEEKRERVAQSS